MREPYSALRRRSTAKSPRRELTSPHNSFEIGFKVGQAIKNWHGSFGFQQAGDDGCGGTYPATPNQTKYRTLTVHIAITTINVYTYSSPSVGTDHTTTNSATVDRQWSVGRLTGGKTIAAATQSYTDIGSFNNAAALLQSFSGVCGGIDYNNSILTIGPWNGITPPVSPATLNAALGFHHHNTGSFGSYFDETSSGSASMSRTALAITQNYFSDTFNEASDGTWNRVESTFTLNITWAYSDPYLASDVHADIDGALFKLAICGMPWRNDTACGIGHFSQYNEGGPFLPESVIAIGDTPGSITYSGSLPDITKTPGVILVDRSNTVGISGAPRGAFVAYTGDGVSPVVFSQPVGQLIKQIWMEKKLDFKAFNWATGSGTTASAGTYLIRSWLYNYRDIAITPTLRQNTAAWSGVTCSQFTVSAPKTILIAPANYCGAPDYHNLPDTTLLDPLGAFLQMDVAQVMFDPTKPYVAPLTNPVSNGNYNPVGAGAALVEAVNVQPSGPALPTNSRPLDSAAAFVPALNAVYPASVNTAAPVNPENFQVVSAGDGETGEITGTLPWKNFP